MPDLGVPQDSDDIEVPYSESSSCSLLKETKPKSYRHPPCWLGSLIAISLLVLVTVTCAIYHFATYVSVSPRPIFNPYPCGTTPSAAREAGCQFDFVIFGWVPDACFDSELSEEFYHLKDGTQSATGYGWPWRTELWNKTQVSSRQVEKGEMDLYTSWEYHYRHCFYTWEKLHRTYLRGGMVDAYVADPEHTKHCQEMIQMGVFVGDGKVMPDMGSVNTKARLKFPSCGYADNFTEHP